MNKFYCFLFYISTFLIQFQSHASHMAGGEFLYEYLGSNKYLITAVFYRDCRGISLSSPEIGVYGGTNAGNSCFQNTLSFTRISITDVTPRCSTAGNPCNPVNTSSGEGIEEHRYTYTMDITKTPFAENIAKSGCCEITFYSRISARNGAITTGPAGNTFVTTLTINFCNLKKCSDQNSNGPVFKSMGKMSYNCCNQATYLDFGGTEPDKDRVKYKLAPALDAIPNTSVGYSSPFTYQYPLTCYCVPPTTIKCTPNITTNPPRGVYLDSMSGLFIFTPTKCDEVAVIAVKVTEYRKDTSGNFIPIAYGNRDIQIWVKDDCDYNKSPKITGHEPIYTVHEGDTLRLSFDLTDETFVPFSTIPDTPLITSWDSSVGKSLTLLNPKDREKKYSFQWITEIGDASESNQYLRVLASDFHCPKPAHSAGVIKIRIQKKGDSLDFSYGADTCGGIRLSAYTKPQDDCRFFWRIIDTTYTDTITSVYGAFWITPKQLRGKYRVQLFAENGYYFYEKVEKIIDFDGYYFHADIGSDTSVCTGSGLEIKPLLYQDIHQTKYLWNIFEGTKFLRSDTNRNISFDSLTKSKRVFLTTTDSIGCAFTTPQKSIVVLPVPTLELGSDATVCFLKTHNIGPVSDSLLQYIWNTGNTNSILTVNSSGVYKLTVTNNMKCSTTDSMKVTFIAAPDLSPALNNTFCQNDMPVDLNKLLLLDGASAPRDTVKYVSRTLQGQSNPVQSGHLFSISKNYNAGTWMIDYSMPVKSCPNATGSFPVVLNYTPNAAFFMSPNGTVLDVFDVTVQNQSTIKDSSKMHFTWHFGRFANDTSNAETDTTIIYPKVSSGYSVQLTATSNKGCFDTAIRHLTILSAIEDIKKDVSISPDLVLLEPNLKLEKLYLLETSGRKVLEVNNNLGIRENGAEKLKHGIYFYSMEISDAAGLRYLVKGKVILPVQP